MTRSRTKAVERITKLASDGFYDAVKFPVFTLHNRESYKRPVRFKLRRTVFL